MEGMEKSLIEVSPRVLEGELTHDGVVMVRYKIKYPSFSSVYFKSVAAALSRLYKTRAEEYRDYVSSTFFDMAVEQYDYAKENSFPFNNYEAYTDYTVTYNNLFILSLYSDKYEFTGGAHGNTVRSSDTWNIKRRRRMLLSEFFPNNENWEEQVFTSIEEQIQSQIASGEGMYFENYQVLIVETFNPESFYVTDKGVAVYYQQYDIAPYSSGIPVFIVT